MSLNFKSASIALYYARYVVLLYLVITLLLSELRFVESQWGLTPSVPYQPLGWQQYVAMQPSRLQIHKCRLLHRCEGMQNYGFNTPVVYNVDPLKNVNDHWQNMLGVPLKPYATPMIQSPDILAHHRHSGSPYPKNMFNVFDFYKQVGINDPLTFATTPVDDLERPKSALSKIKEIVANSKKRIISHHKNKNVIGSNKSSTPLNYTEDGLIGSNIETNWSQFTETEYNEDHRKKMLLYEFKQGLDKFERQFYTVTFTKLASMNTVGARAENAISFVQSGLFLQLFLLALSVERSSEVKAKIDKCIGLQTNPSNTERIQLIDDVVSFLPNCTHGLIFRWTSHLVLGSNHVTEEFKNGPASALRLQVNQLNGTESPEMITSLLNRMVEEDSGGAIHNTFEPEDVSGTISAIFFTTLYLRSRWRSAPTVLNGSRTFRDFPEDPNRTIRMIRINDMMRYANLTDCDAEALEVFYGKPGLSLLILVPQGSSLRRLAAFVTEAGLGAIMDRMRSRRVAADLPLYTLRMSLLLPSKLEGLGLPDLLHVDNSTDSELKISHGLQRLMFWSEAGRTAFKDDGLEWDATPDMKIIVDRPYLFFVRWQNITLMNGNFVL